MSKKTNRPLIFPEWLDKLRPFIGIGLAIAPAYLLGVLYYGGNPTTTDVGYMPDQPVPYDHSLHAGELGIDCRYCHNTVEQASHAAIPSTETCMNCHSSIHTESEKLAIVRESYATGEPIRWVRIHDLPDYAYFNHSAHVTRGVGCVSCHGRIDKMEVVYQEERLSMGWCLDCHRNPEPHLRPVSEVTNMAWVPPADDPDYGARLRAEHNINPSEDCSTCHR